MYLTGRDEGRLMFLIVIHFLPMNSSGNTVTRTIQLTLQKESPEKLIGWIYFCEGEILHIKKNKTHCYHVSDHSPFPHLSQQDATVTFHMNYSRCNSVSHWHMQPDPLFIFSCGKGPQILATFSVATDL